MRSLPPRYTSRSNHPAQAGQATPRTLVAQTPVAALEAGHPDLIATANIGCYAYLRQEARVPVVHWVELLT
jgi:Fe-S oxidoreductase